MLRFGIVGMGIRGRMYAGGIREHRDAELVAVCDVSKESREYSEKAFEVPVYEDHRQMLEHTRLDAVIVATPDFAHFNAVIDAAAAGLHILVEKPLATTFSEAEEMARAVDSAGVRCMVAFENRFNPPFVNAAEAIAGGELGNIISMNSRLNDTIYVPTKMIGWAGKSSPGWFLLTHALDLACWFKTQQPVTEVYASGYRGILAEKGIDTYDMIQTVVKFADGTSALFENGWILPESLPAVFDFKFEIIGDRGAIFIDTQDQMIHKSTDRYQYPATLSQFPLDMLDAFIEALQRDKPLPVPLSAGVENVRIVEAVHRSMDLKRPVKL